MSRPAKLILAGLVAIALLPVALLFIVVAVGNTGFGRHLVERLVSEASGGQVTLQRLSGRFPDALRVDRVELRDADGAWAVADNVSLDWSPLQLFAAEARIERVAAAQVALLRLPKPAAESSNGNLWFPVSVDVTALHIAQLDLAAPIAGTTASVSVDAAGQLDSLTRMHATATVKRLDEAGRYSLDGTLVDGHLSAHLDVQEPAHGLLSRVAGLPDLGPLSATASLEGPRSAEAATITVTAGPLRASARGSIDLTGQSADLTIAAEAPAMTPSPTVSWQSIDVHAHVQGPFDRPRAEGTVAIEKAKVGDVSADKLTADLHGSGGTVALAASLAGLRAPGPAGALFQSAPVAITADVTLDAPDRPFHFTLTHPLMSVTGHGFAGPKRDATAVLDLPALAPIAAAFNFDLNGHATLTADLSETGAATKILLGGTIAVLGGAKPLPAMLGDAATLNVAATAHGGDVQIDHVALDGATLHLSADGGLAGGTLSLGWTLAFADLAVLDPTLTGTLSAQGTLAGPPDHLALDATARGTPTVRGFPIGPVELSISAKGLPDAPSAIIGARGTLAGAALRLDASFERRRDGGVDFPMIDLQWKSLAAKGAVALPPKATWPQGRIELNFSRLADLAPLLGIDVNGSAAGTIDMGPSNGRPGTRLNLAATNLTVADGAIDSLRLDGTVGDLATRPAVALRLVAAGIAGNGVTGTATLTAGGALDAMLLHLAADLHRQDTAAHVGAAGTLDTTRRMLALNQLDIQSKGETVRLLGPARFDFAKGVEVDRLRLGADQAVLDIDGMLMPRLAVTGSLRNVTPAVAKPFLPGLAALGTLEAQARLTGTLSAPSGTIHVIGHGLQIRSAIAGTIAPATLDAKGELANGAMQVDLRLNSGRTVDVAVTGRVPLTAVGGFDLGAKGTLDLAVLDPVLSAAGRRVEGQLTLDASVTGGLAAPRISGTATLAKGEVQDFTLGLRLADVTAQLEADDGDVKLVKFDATAGPGTITASGDMAALGDGMPVSLVITARNARPLSSDLLTATLDADLTVRGKALETVELGGQIRVHRADITIPDGLPPSVAVLNVQTRGAPLPPPAPPPLAIGLNLDVNAPERVFVRGRGLDAEMGGRLRIGGTAVAPLVSGGFDLRHGTFNLGSQSLNFTSGRVSFGGTGLTRRLDPTLNFVATSAITAGTVTLTVSGYADAPNFAITSAPSLPQDEALSQLLFGVSVKQLSVFQLAQITDAVASITGAGGGLDPFGALRRKLGLDRLSAGSSGTGASLQAGKYIANGVYVGAQQGVSGGTRAQVQIDLTKHLKLDTVIGTGPASPSTTVTPDNDPGSSIGLTYQFEY